MPYRTYSSATAAAAAAGRHVVLELIPHQLPVHPPGGISYSGNAGLHGRGFGDQLVCPDKKKNFVKDSLVRGMDPDPDPALEPDPDPCITM